MSKKASLGLGVLVAIAALFVAGCECDHNRPPPRIKTQAEKDALTAGWLYSFGALAFLLGSMLVAMGAVLAETSHGKLMGWGIFCICIIIGLFCFAQCAGFDMAARRIAAGGM